MISQYDPAQGVQFVTVTADESGQRIDNFLLRLIGRVPKSVVYKKLRKGEVRINKKRAKPTQKVQTGDVVRIPPIHINVDEQSVQAVLPSRMMAEVIESIHFEDNDLLVLDKPAGIAVHSGSGVDFGIIDLLRADRYQGQYLELAHRLDRDTSGLLLLAKSAETLREIQQSMRSLESTKRYHCWVYGDWSSQKREVTLPLKRIQRGQERIVEVATEAEVASGEAKTAATNFQVLDSREVKGQRVTLLEAELITGRTHQIRVHTQSQGHPILFDRKYGDRDRDKRLSTANGSRTLRLRAVALTIHIFGQPRRFVLPGLEQVER